MSVDIMRLYGPGLSFYLAHRKPSARMNAPVGSPSMSLRDVAVSTAMRSKRSIGILDETNTDRLTSNICHKYSATLKALHASNELLESRARKLSNNIAGLELDVMRVQRHIKAFHGELLMTWQADILTRLVEVVYERSEWKMPGGITASSHEGMSEAKVTLMYRTAARKIKKETLKRRFGLSVQYYLALQRYDEVSYPHGRLSAFEARIRFAQSARSLTGCCRKRRITVESVYSISGQDYFPYATVGL
ncbi:hypothetical protein BDV38DRAFT_240686 [Aspergillus pseudotamarii]|uniref:Uncharacterized protein n=1 Tax=Aspergillus pseudotamarii TaxID=132259 RepID=A0A5N6T1L7_ASPPS|nr:uncharacterized protein BDV38DRAFT_240686 [Aspergillus pseudotamarii]KAE8139964.1 hypothetical protein BDV38DRAFT_240686 [Aspergillus pseudotamarii]